MKNIPTEPVGSIPRPAELMKAVSDAQEGRISKDELAGAYDNALLDTIAQFTATGSPVITDGEQTKPSFATYPIHGIKNIAPDGVAIPFADGHTRRLPRLTAGPFKYAIYADAYLAKAKTLTDLPVKQTVIAASALSLIYPTEGIPDYSREQFLNDLVNQAAEEIRACLLKGAYNVQIDFTEGRLAVKIDPSLNLLKEFVALNNRVLEHFSEEERQKIGVHTCPGGDKDSTHSADVDYAELLPLLFEINAGSFYLQLASEPDRKRVLKVISETSKPSQTIFIGAIDPINPEVETPNQVMKSVLEAAEFIDIERLGVTDDCGFSPFGDDTSTSRDIAFAKIRARVAGTLLAEKELGVA